MIMKVPRLRFNWTHSFIAFVVTITMAYGAEPVQNPVEVGSVRWGRDLDAALKKSADTGRPVLVLFQEIPGCAGCRTFGQTVLTSPLLVEAIEDEFLPVLVYNNRRSGMDKKLLDRFKEPAWNYQVVRFLNSEGRDIIARKDRIWSLGGIASRMIEALKAAHRPIPRYLETVAAEDRTKNHAVSAFAMHCFWTGEMELGKVDGVLSTEAGWTEGREVTRVVHDKEKITLQDLARKARNARCALKVYAPGKEANALKNFPTGQLDARYRKASPSDQKKQLAYWSAIQRLPGLTQMQKTKVNAFIRSDRSKALQWLSPRQRRALRTRKAGSAVEAEKRRR